jgi:hypothetical protein
LSLASVTISAIGGRAVLAQRLLPSGTSPLRTRDAHVSPLEQHVHSYLEILSLVAAALLVGAFLEEPTAFARRDGSVRPPGPMVAIVAGAMFLAGVAIDEEFWRTLRVRLRAS